jgi:hypothetical protein
MGAVTPQVIKITIHPITTVMEALAITMPAAVGITAVTITTIIVIIQILVTIKIVQLPETTAILKII